MNNEQRQLQDILTQDLDMYLSRFFFSIRKESGADDRQYEPITLSCIYSSLQRHLSEKGKMNIKQDEAFQHSRNVMAAKIEKLKKSGKGSKPHASEPFTSEELQQF